MRKMKNLDLIGGLIGGVKIACTGADFRLS